jgi:Zn-dependent peptidase ImmA (M78 family)
MSKKESYSLEEADYAFAGMNSVSEEFRVIIARALSKLPKEIVDWTAEAAFFFSSSEEYFAFTLRKIDFAHKQGFIFLSENLKWESEEKQAFMIAHEIAHLKLNHRSPILDRLSEQETRKQEKEADILATKWLH